MERSGRSGCRIRPRAASSFISRGRSSHSPWPGSARSCRSKRGAGCRSSRRRGRSSPQFLSEPLPLPRRQIAKALPQLAALLWAQALELTEVLADARLLALGQLLELPVTLPNHPALVDVERLPALEPLARLLPLFRRHRQPALRAARERALALRRQLRPARLEICEELALLRRQRAPADCGRGLRLGGPGHRRGQQQQSVDAQYRNDFHRFSAGLAAASVLLPSRFMAGSLAGGGGFAAAGSSSASSTQSSSPSKLARNSRNSASSGASFSAASAHPEKTPAQTHNDTASAGNLLIAQPLCRSGATSWSHV